MLWVPIANMLISSQHKQLYMHHCSNYLEYSWLYIDLYLIICYGLLCTTAERVCVCGSRHTVVT